MKELVSVIIPTYKRAEMLTRAIDSVLEQTYENIQVVVVDDNNPNTEWRNETSLKMQKYIDDERVKYVCHHQNMNGSVARNTGISNADGDVICFLDDDDWFYPNKIELQLKYLLEHSEYQAVYCGWIRDGKKIVPYKTGNLSYELLSGIDLIYTNVIMIWKKAAIECGGWDETFKRHQEAAFMLRYFRNGGEIGVVSDVLVEFDISDRSNVAPTSNINEEYTNHYLITFEDMIEKCEFERKGSKKNILSYRYRGIFLSHIKCKNYGGAIKLYIKMIKKMPIKFNADIVKYLINKVV